MTERPPFPAVVDSSMMGTFRSCPQKAFLGYLQHWKAGESSVHLIAGKAFAAGLETARVAFYMDKMPADDAIALGLRTLWKEYGTFEAPAESPKSVMRIAGALEYYFTQYPLGADGASPHIFPNRHGIEFSFLEPIDVKHPVTGDPILFSGRADMVADAFGGLFLYDEKTTTSLGPSWLRQWDMRAQFTAYCWGLRGHGFRPTGVVVRGVAILKESFNTAQAITYRSNYEVDLWLHQTKRDLHRMIRMWEEGYWDYNLDHACAEYGGCAYVRVCKSMEPEKWLQVYFHRRVWDPVNRVETALETTE